MTQDSRPPRGVLPGEWDPPRLTLDAPSPNLQRIKLAEGVYAAHDVLTASDCQVLIDAMIQSGQADPVSVQGRQDMPDDRIGSVRATAWAPELGEQFWHKLKPVVPHSRQMTSTTSTDWFAPKAYMSWEALTVSPVLRFMRYESGGQHYAHYDAGYDYGDGRRSLMSLVFYLTSVDPRDGGATRFIEDNQTHLPTWQRDHDDWPRATRDDEVFAHMSPLAGSALFFDHRICHDVQLYTGSTPRIIIRGDVVFRATSDAVELEHLL